MTNNFDVYRDPSRIFSPADLAALDPADLSAVDNSSTLAASLLMVPDVHNEERLSVLWGIAAFPGWNCPDAEGEMGAEGSPFDQMEKSLSDFDDEPLLTMAGLIAELPDYAVGAKLPQQMQVALDNTLDQYRAAKIITAAAQDAPDATTAHQVLATAIVPGLDIYPGAVAALRAAGHSHVGEGSGLPDSRDVRERAAQQIDMMEVLGTPADALAEMALNVPGSVDDERLGMLLSSASPYLVAHWLAGRHRTHPTREAVRVLGGNIDSGVLNDARQMFNRLAAGEPAVDGGLDSGGPPLPIPWIGLVAEYLFLPSAPIPAATAALLWGRIVDAFGDDSAATLALCLSQAAGNTTVKL